MANPFAAFAESSSNPFAQFAAPPADASIPTPVGSGIPGPRKQVEPPDQRTMVQKALAYGVDVPAALASHVVGGLGMPVAAWAGLLGGGGQKGAEAAMQAYGQQLYQPRTPEGEAALAALGKATEPLAAFGLSPVGPSAPGRVRPALQAGADIGRAVLPDVEAAALAKDVAKTRANVAKSQALGPKIDAAAQGREIGLAAPPTQVAPTALAKTETAFIGSSRVINELNKANEAKWNAAAREDMRLPQGTRLDAEAFQKARSHPDVSGPYQEVSRLGTLNDPNLNVAVQLEKLKPQPLVGDTGQASAVSTWLTKVQDDIASGIDAAAVTQSIRQMRDEASQLYKAQKAGAVVSPTDLAMARAKLGTADALENLIAQNISDQTLLTRYQKARSELARTYDYERATNFATNQIDPKVLADLAAENRPLSGNAAKIANFAANFPEVSRPGTTVTEQAILDYARRGSIPAALGALAGGVVGPGGAVAGMAAGAQVGNAIANAMARRLASAEVQNRLGQAVDYRLPELTQATTPAEIRYTPGQPVPYDWSRATAPNWTPGRPGPNVTFGAEPPPSVPLLGAATAEETMAGVQRMRAQEYASAKMRDEAAMRAAERAPQTPYGQMVEQLGGRAKERAGREVILEIDPITGQLREASQGIRGATPETFRDFGASLKSASEKVTSGRPFDLTAAEKVAWERTKVDLSEVAPGFKTLTDKAIAEKMMDRQWVDAAITKAREKAAAFEQIAQRAKDNEAKQTALANRERMMDLLSSLEESFRKERPQARGGQGPKTRAFIRNQLAPESEVTNALIKP